MRAANLALKFLLELCAFAAFAVWGAATSVALAVAALAAAGSVVAAVVLAGLVVLNTALLVVFRQWAAADPLDPHAT